MTSSVSDYGDPYVEARDGNLYMRGTRVQLASVIQLWRVESRTPEQIQREDYTHLSLAAVYGAIAFYLHHQAEMDTLFAAQDAEWEWQRAAAEAADPARYAALRSRLAEARDFSATPQHAAVDVDSAIA